jgi:hypothetical protein
MGDKKGEAAPVSESIKASAPVCVSMLRRYKCTSVPCIYFMPVVTVPETKARSYFGLLVGAPPPNVFSNLAKKASLSKEVLLRGTLF